MRVRGWAAAVATFGVTVLGGTPAQAFTAVQHDWWDFEGYDCLSQACWIHWISVSVYSDPRFGDCAGTDGAYTSCTFSVYCQTEGWASKAYDLECDAQPPTTCPVTVEPQEDPFRPDWGPVEECRLESYGHVVVPAGSCQDIVVRLTARSAVDSVPLTYRARLCTSGNGPSLVALPYDSPQWRIDVP